LDREASLIGDHVKVALLHYSGLLRRHVVSTTEIAELAQRIYRKHRRAIDLIIEHRPDLQSELSEILTAFINEAADLQLEHSTKGAVRFSVPGWDSVVPLAGDGTWCKSPRVLAFEFQNGPAKLMLGLYIGPGAVEVRQKILDFAEAGRPTFRPSQKKLGKSWNMVWQTEFLGRPNLEGDKSDAIQKLNNEWDNFLRLDLPRLSEAVRSWDFQARADNASQPSA
jgi:hypothetical protein